MNVKDRSKMVVAGEAASTPKARDAFANMNTSLMNALDQNRVVAQNLMRAVQEESLRFVNARLEHTTRAFERSKDCQGISALITLQHDWLLDAARDYAELNKRFSDVLHGAAESGVESTAAMPVVTVRAARQEPMNEGVAAV